MRSANFGFNRSGTAASMRVSNKILVAFFENEQLLTTFTITRAYSGNSDAK